MRVFGFFLPQSLAAGGGNVVVLTAGVNGRLDFGLTALQGKTDGAQRDFSLSFTATSSHNGTLTKLKATSLFF